MAKPPSDALLTEAAELRAGGNKWEAVGKALNCPSGTVRDWVRQYPARWKAALSAAEQRLVREVAAESVLVLRNQLRSKDEKIARDAARVLTDLRLDLTKLELVAEPTPSLTSDAARVVAFLDGHTDEHLARLAAAVFPHASVAQPVPAEPGPVDGAA